MAAIVLFGHRLPPLVASIRALQINLSVKPMTKLHGVSSALSWQFAFMSSSSNRVALGILSKDKSLNYSMFHWYSNSTLIQKTESLIEPLSHCRLILEK
jgi:hypothetical protein